MYLKSIFSKRHLWQFCAGLMLLLFISIATQTQASTPTAAQIEVSNQSSVSGYDIGIFGSGFGNSAGSVTILGANAQIKEWSNTFVRAVVPEVADGKSATGLKLTPAAGAAATAPFTVYTIDPYWLRAPETTYENVAFGKPTQLRGVNTPESQCTNFETGQPLPAADFLTNYRCRYDFGAKFGADSDLNTTASIAINFQQNLQPGAYIFQFFSRSDWSAAVPDNCPGTGYPGDYTIEYSANGSNWQGPLATVTDNLRGNLSHKITLPSGVKWLRLHVTDSVADCLNSISGRDFEMKEVRVYRVDGPTDRPGDAFAVYGDSLAAGTLNTYLGSRNINAQVTDYPSNFPVAPLGFAGFKAVNLAQDFEDPNELADAYNGDAIAGDALYWGFALGTNDMTLSGPDDPGFTDPNSHLNQYDDAMEVDAVQWIIEHGRVPIIARLPDTNTDIGGFGFLEAKIKLLGYTDEIAAKYRLVPGPDFYTEFRLNIERNGSNYLGTDGTHFTDEGRLRWIDMWAETLKTIRAERGTANNIPAGLTDVFPFYVRDEIETLMVANANSRIQLPATLMAMQVAIENDATVDTELIASIENMYAVLREQGSSNIGNWLDTFLPFDYASYEGDSAESLWTDLVREMNKQVRQIYLPALTR